MTFFSSALHWCSKLSCPRYSGLREVVHRLVSKLSTGTVEFSLPVQALHPRPRMAVTQADISANARCIRDHPQMGFIDNFSGIPMLFLLREAVFLFLIPTQPSGCDNNSGRSWRLGSPLWRGRFARTSPRNGYKSTYTVASRS